MNFKNLQLVIFCAFFWLINQVEGQSARCDYKYDYFWSSEYEYTYVSYYSCYLYTEQANYDEKLTKIDGQHLREHSDPDVKLVDIYMDQELKTFSSIFCQQFTNLEIIQINNAELESIDEDSLINCKNLDKMLLNNNKIQELPEYLLIINSKLTDLWIEKNQLTTLPENLFLYQKELKKLGFNGNQINFLPGNIFRRLVKLEVLHLDNNKLESIKSEWFVNLQNLKWLTLNGNQITEITSICFESLGSLEKLFLFENKIKDLNSDSFDGLQNLQILSLYSNDISDLPVGVFTPLNNLQLLILNNNMLTTIHSDSFGVHNLLSNVLFQNNKINAIDEQFIDNTEVSFVHMENNICCQLDAKTKIEIKSNLKECFENYQPRQSQSQISYPLSNQNICGKSTAGEGNIIGGSFISRGSFPWIAALVTPVGEFFCGGTLVSSRKVLTAAHCIQDKHADKATSASELIILIGVHDLNKAFEVGRVIYAVETVNVHPDWNTLTEAFDADIAVLVLEHEVISNKYIQPICMPTSDSNIIAITTGIVVGFGRSEDETKIHENIPKMLEIPIHSNEDCFLQNYLLATLSSRRTFCAGTGTGIGVCKGDSGSGLIVTDGNAYYLRGIVSASIISGRYGCDVDAYAVFTDVTTYVEWINEISTSRF